MPTYFVINKLDSAYDWSDFEFGDYGIDYAIDVHNIPEEYIENVEVSPTERKVEITILEDKSISQEDWYYCLLNYAA